MHKWVLSFLAAMFCFASPLVSFAAVPYQLPMPECKVLPKKFLKATDTRGPKAYIRKVSTKPLIVLDAGHGGNDQGAKVNALMEKKITLMTTLLVKKYLIEMGYQVVLTRSRDVYLTLPHRVEIANKTPGAVFVSIHYNASRNPDANGLEVYYCNTAKSVKASKRLAQCVLTQLISHTHAASRGVKHGNFHVIRETEGPAILVEGGFMTNPEERSLLRTKDYLERLAKGIALGVDKYLG